MCFGGWLAKLRRRFNLSYSQLFSEDSILTRVGSSFLNFDLILIYFERLSISKFVLIYENYGF